ncbi:MAG: beta-ketoacyl-ACP synthase II [Candidatus Sungbacteria bacterium]|uniref:Beta-ketoacyl-ACP synthase II n=1 Tax=Candidatus Sungiibacteriota bacterium TaxID=2750080 RepID=A0A932VQS0_9BACT|nr:beta-ketoacyl-ACP synthase II [Candidatus Sungbacteria bacterium]
MAYNRAYIVGMGVVSPLGISVPEMWDNLLAGVSGTRLNTFNTFSKVVENFDPATLGFDVVTAEVKGFDPADWMDRKTVRREDPVCWFALAAAKQAMADAGITITPSLQERAAVIVGSGIGGLTTLEREDRRLMQKGAKHVNAFLVPRMMPNAASAFIARHFGICGPCLSLASACATGADTIGEGFRLIKHGYADMVIAGGSEATITPLSLAGFRNMEAMAKRIDDPARRSRPFDCERDGFVMGEGAGVVVLVSADFAEAHHIKPLAEIAGYGRTQDAYHVTSPHPEGVHVARAVRLALAEGRVTPDEVVYINPHGTSTPMNDPIEARIIQSVFQERSGSIPVSSCKAMLGHMIGAAGTVETIVCAMTLMTGIAHRSVNLDTIDPECACLDHVLGEPRHIGPGAVVKIALGFGGANAALVLLPAA